MNIEHDTGTIFQLKMTNGDEIVTFVIKWNGEEDVQVKYPLKMVDLMPESPFDVEVGGNTRTFVYRPWMAYQDDIHEDIYINPINIVSYMVPSENMRQSYKTSVAEIVAYYLSTETKITTNGSRLEGEFEFAKLTEKLNDSASPANVVNLFDRKETDKSRD